MDTHGEMGEEMRLSGSQIVGLYCPRSPSTYSAEEWSFIDRAIVRMHDEEGLQWYTIGISTGVEQSTAKRRYEQATGRKAKKNHRDTHAKLAAQARRLKARGRATERIAEDMGISVTAVIALLADLPHEWGRDRL